MRMGIPTHVWVDVTGKWADSASPGVLLMWQKDGDNKWEAWVIYAATYSTGSGLTSYVTQGWVDAAHIRKADTPPPRS